MIKNCPMRHENGNCIPAGGFCTANKNICEALLNAYRMGKEQLSKEGTTSDLISRQAALEIKFSNGIIRRGVAYVRVDELVNKLKALPTIQPEPQWIPVSERLPEEHEWIGTKKFGTTISDEVYVTFENEKGERFCRHMKFQNGELSRYDQFHMDTWFKGSKPIAWMLLPEAYNPNK